jgi:hypothetical protein
MPIKEAEQTLQTVELQIERKTFLLSLRQNHRGQFLKITEQVGKNHSTVIVPATGLLALIQKLSTIQVGGSPPPVPETLPAASS